MLRNRSQRAFLSHGAIRRNDLNPLIPQNVYRAVRSDFPEHRSKELVVQAPAVCRAICSPRGAIAGEIAMLKKGLMIGAAILVSAPLSFTALAQSAPRNAPGTPPASPMEHNAPSTTA